MTTMDLDHLWRFALALFIGALIGTERTLRHAPEQGEFAGLRTFILLAQAGALSAWLSQATGEIAVFLVVMAGMLALLAVAHSIRFRADPHRTGYSTEVAGAITFLLGGAALYTEPELVIAMGIVTSIVLALKEQLHATVRKLTGEELLAALRLLFATFVILPFLPKEPVDPWGAVVPYELWLLVILISAISMAGYVAVRWTGATRGTLVTGLLGGLVSSTAVTMSLSRRSVEAPALATVLSAAVLLSWVVMFARVAVEVAVVYPPLLRTLAAPLASVAGVALVGVLALWWWSRRDAQEPVDHALEHLKSPFRIGPAVQFALFFALVLLAGELVRAWFPTEGLYALAVLSGVADVDAITLSLARLAKDGNAPPDVAASAILVAVTTNSAVKLGYAVFLGAPALRVRLGLTGAAVVLGGLVAALLQ